MLDLTPAPGFFSGYFAFAIMPFFSPGAE